MVMCYFCGFSFRENLIINSIRDFQTIINRRALDKKYSQYSQSLAIFFSEIIPLDKKGFFDSALIAVITYSKGGKPVINKRRKFWPRDLGKENNIRTSSHISLF